MSSKKGGGSDLNFGDMQALINQAARANRINTTTPFGSAVFSGPGNNQLDVTFSPGQQQLFQGQLDVQNQLSSFADRMAGMLPTNPVNTRGLQDLPTAPTIDDFNRDRVEGAFYDRGAARLEPQMIQARRRLEQQLTDRGIPVGSEAYNEALANFGRQENDAFSSLSNDAILAGGAEQSREGALARSMAELQAGIRQQGLGERTGLRNQQLFELASVLGQTSPTQPTFPGPGQVDAMGAANLSFANAANQQARRDAAKGQLAGGLGQIGSAAFGFF